MKLNNLVKLIFVAFVAFAFSTTSYANETSAEVQKIIKENNLKEVKYEDVLKAIGDGTRKNAKALILDARPMKKYKVSHIPSAQSLPDTKFDTLYKILYGDIDKSKEVIVYCGGETCTKSPQVAVKLIANGHKNVKVYVGGMPEWKKKNYVEIDVLVAKNLFDKQSALFLDARPWPKYAASSIVGALGVPDTKFDDYAKFMPVDKSAPIVTFCSGYNCHKSHSIASKLVDLGYTNVKVLAAGLPEWKSKGYNMTGSSGSASKKELKKIGPSKSGVLEQGVDTGTVDGEWFAKNYKKLPKSVTIVDVRAKSDYEKGTLPGAINIQAEKMKPKELAKAIPSTGDVIFFCGTGTRGLESVGFLKDIKYERMDHVFYLDANVECDKNNKCKIEPNEPLGI